MENEYVKKCLEDEAQAILDLILLLTDDFDKAVELIFQNTGKVIVTGVGKSGLIGAKIAATFASTGTPAFFLDPLNAVHGDLGMVSTNDIVLAISNSGKTKELLNVVFHIKQRGIPIIGMSGNVESPLAQNSLYHLPIIVKKEICPLNLAPTSSAIATLAMGDALACTLMKKRNWTSIDFFSFHPDGNLSRLNK